MTQGVIPGVIPGVVPGHMGQLHPYEHALVLLLAFGPVLLLAVTIRIARRRNTEQEDRPVDVPDDVPDERAAEE